MGNLSIDGQVVSPDTLREWRARQLVSAIKLDGSSAELAECIASDCYEAVIFDVQVERPNQPVYDIKRRERVAVRFSSNPDVPPDVLALRDDFPIDPPHLNQRARLRPVSLCLYEQPWEVIRAEWSGARCLQQICWWLDATARGMLHGKDQPLEPLMFDHQYDLIVPSNYGQLDPQPPLVAKLARVSGSKRRVLVAQAPEQRFGEDHAVLIFVDTPLRTHGIIHATPNTLQELAVLVDHNEFKLIEVIRQSLRQLPAALKEKRQILRPLIVLRLPKARTPGGAVEATEWKGFLAASDLETLGVDVGAWELHGGNLGTPLVPDATADGRSTDCAVVSVVHRLSWERAAASAGQGIVSQSKIVAIGAGAIGSQVCMTLAREAHGQWIVLDPDAFMPHNAVRHAISEQAAVGVNKAMLTAFFMNEVAADAPIARYIAAEYPPSKESQELVSNAIAEADLVLDMSASLPVSRTLSNDESVSRAAAAFLNPAGTDLVVLAEDEARELRLHSLEMLYYAAIVETDNLREHFRQPESRIRYGGSCRDVSVEMPQTNIGTLSAIAAARLRAISNDREAAIGIWRLDPAQLTVTKADIPCDEFNRVECSEWQVSIRHQVLRQLDEWRKRDLPNETGGVLIGGVDRDRKTVHIVLALDSPPDSIQWPDCYIRGVEGLKKRCQEIGIMTMSQLEYIGEWHSHPDGAGTRPSQDDRKVHAWIARYAEAEGRPPLMLIMGADRARIVFDREDGVEVECPV